MSHKIDHEEEICLQDESLFDSASGGLYTGWLEFSTPWCMHVSMDDHRNAIVLMGITNNFSK